MSNYLDFAVLVGKQHDDGKTEDDNALKDQQDRPQDPVEGDDAG